MTKNYEGGYASVGRIGVCHPNVTGRPDCYTLITRYRHPILDCEECSIEMWNRIFKDEN
jgi:hypothetical protein